MVKKISAISVISILLCLSSCSYFGLSLFPARLSHIEATLDLSDLIENFVKETPDNWRSHVFVLKNSLENERVFVLIDIEYDERKKLIILDNLLKIIKNYTLTGLGELHMMDADDSFVIGRRRFNDACEYDDYEIDIPTDWDGFSYTTNNFLLRADGEQLEYQIYDNAWTYPPIDHSIFIRQGYYHLEKVTYDPDRTDEEIILFLHTWGGYEEKDTLTVVFTKASDYSSGLNTPILIKYPGFSIEEIEDIYYTKKGFIAQDHSGRTKLIGFDGEILDEFNYSSSYRDEKDYDIEGNYGYYFDPQNRTINKFSIGWMGWME